MSELDSQAKAQDGAPRPASLADAALERLRWSAGPRPIPVIHQLTQLECGVASLAMVLAYHGRHVRMEELRDQIGVNRDGANAYTILAAARQQGLRARGLKIDVEDLVHLEPATILHWEFNHFLVFERLEREHVCLIDPASGRRRVSLEQFQKAFTGVALAFEPAEGFAPLSKQHRPWARQLQAVLGGGQLGRVVALSLCLQLFALAAPIVTGAVVDSVVPRGDHSLLTMLSLALLATVVFHFVAALTRSTLLLHLRTRLDASMSMAFLEHLFALPFVFFEQRSAGDLLMRLNSNATIRELLTSSVLSVLLDGGVAALYLVALFVLDPTLGLLACALALMQGVIYALSRSRQRELTADDLRCQAKARGYEVEMINGVETLKAQGSEHNALQHWSNLFVETLNTSLARGRLAALVDSGLSSLRLCAPIAMLLLGADRVLRGELSLGSMLALNALSVGFLLPLSALIGTASQLQVLGTYLERLDDVFDAAPEVELEGAADVKQLSGSIVLQDVSFRYGERSPNVVRDVSVEIHPGQFVAIVGPSGSGKSTLASLLVALYRPNAGRILYDGRDLCALDPRAVRRRLGIVVQKAHLFAGSVRSNIALCDPGLPIESIVEAAQTAKIHDEVMAMPMQYETLIRDGGAALSGGQRQRLALARALVHKPSIVLLDEATSSLDAVTEAQVQAALDALKCTRIVIAHRLSTVARADLILVMKEGRIVERGTHTELVAQRGAYHALVNAQLSESC